MTFTMAKSSWVHNTSAWDLESSASSLRGFHPSSTLKIVQPARSSRIIRLESPNRGICQHARFIKSHFRPGIWNFGTPNFQQPHVLPQFRMATIWEPPCHLRKESVTNTPAAPKSGTRRRPIAEHVTQGPHQWLGGSRMPGWGGEVSCQILIWKELGDLQKKCGEPQPKFVEHFWHPMLSAEFMERNVLRVSSACSDQLLPWNRRGISPSPNLGRVSWIAISLLPCQHCGHLQGPSHGWVHQRMIQLQPHDLATWGCSST